MVLGRGGGGGFEAPRRVETPRPGCAPMAPPPAPPPPALVHVQEDVGGLRLGRARRAPRRGAGTGGGSGRLAGPWRPGRQSDAGRLQRVAAAVPRDERGVLTPLELERTVRISQPPDKQTNSNLRSLMSTFCTNALPNRTVLRRSSSK